MKTKKTNPAQPVDCRALVRRIRELKEELKAHAIKAEADEDDEYLGLSVLDWTAAVDHMSMAANSIAPNR